MKKPLLLFVFAELFYLYTQTTVTKIVWSQTSLHAMQYHLFIAFGPGTLQAFVVLNEFEKATEDLEKVNIKCILIWSDCKY